MDYQRKTPYAGTPIYQPRTVLAAEKLAVLRRSLIDAGLVQEPENPAIVIDWYLEAQGPGGAAWQCYVVLYRDGGDSEEPACVFYRKEVNRRENLTVETLHIPLQETQPRLTAAWKWLQDASGQQLETLTGYLDEIIGDDAVWQPFPSGG